MSATIKHPIGSTIINQAESESGSTDNATSQSIDTQVNIRKSRFFYSPRIAVYLVKM